MTVKPGDPARLLTVDEPGEADRWQLRALVPAVGYTAALAVEGSDWQLATWTWPERPQDHIHSAPV